MELEEEGIDDPEAHWEEYQKMILKRGGKDVFRVEVNLQEGYVCMNEMED